MTKQIDRPSVLAMGQMVMGLIGALLVTVGATTVNSINKDIDNVEKIQAIQSQLLTNSNEKINKNQIIIHELLTEIKWQKAQLNDFKDRIKIMEAK